MSHCSLEVMIISQLTFRKINSMLDCVVHFKMFFVNSIWLLFHIDNIFVFFFVTLKFILTVWELLEKFILPFLWRISFRWLFLNILIEFNIIRILHFIKFGSEFFLGFLLKIFIWNFKNLRLFYREISFLNLLLTFRMFVIAMTMCMFVIMRMWMTKLLDIMTIV